MNLAKKLLLVSSFSIFILIIPNSFALDKANLKVDNNKIDINDYIKLHISIETSTGGSIGINDIAGIEGNFDVAGQSQSQSSSSQVSILNGKTESKTVTQYNIVLELKAKKKGIYEIGPANIVGGNEKIKTNSVKVEVTGDKLFINGNHLPLSQNNSLNNNNQIGPGNNNQKDDEILDFGRDMKKRNFDDDKNIYLLFITLFIVGGGLYLIIKKNKNNNPKAKNKEKIENNLDLNFSENQKTEFEENKENLVYPELEDVDFIKKLESIFKIKLSNKYKLSNIGKYDYNELLEKTENFEEKNYLEKIINLINKVKYSNSVGNNEKNNLIDLIKNI